METFALFENGTSSRIILGFLEHEQDPLKLVPLNIGNWQLVQAATNGFYSAYQVLRHMGYIKGCKYCFSYQFEEGIDAYGASAGLACALKFAQAVYPGREFFPYNLAATGVISDGTKDAQVKRVEGMQPKLRAALLRLHWGDRMYYPAANDADVDDALRVAATDKGIELLPVTTLMDAIATLLPPPPPASKPIRLAAHVVAYTLLLLLCVDSRRLFRSDLLPARQPLTVCVDSGGLSTPDQLPATQPPLSEEPRLSLTVCGDFRGLSTPDQLPATQPPLSEEPRSFSKKLPPSLTAAQELALLQRKPPPTPSTRYTLEEHFARLAKSGLPSFDAPGAYEVPTKPESTVTPNNNKHITSKKQSIK
jgi:hypothetical protein